MRATFFRGFSSGILVLALLATSAMAQTGQDALRFTQRFPAQGARLMGMGGANLAGLADFSALYGNPAGLGYFKKSMFSGSLHTTSTTDDALFHMPGFSAGTEQDIRGTGLGNVAYIHRMPTARGSMVTGISLTQTTMYDRELVFSGENGANSITDYFMPLPGEFTVTPKTGGTYDVSFNRPLSFIAYETYAIDFSEDLYTSGDPVPFLPAVTRGTVAQDGRVTEDGYMNEISFGGAVEGVRNVMFGLSANISYGKYDFTRLFTEDDINNDNDGVNPGTTDFQFLELTEGFQSSLVGVNLRTGLSGQLQSGFRFGLSLETPTYYSVNDEYYTALDVQFDNGDAFSYGHDDADDEGAGTFEYQITTPWRLGGGLAFGIGNFSVSADAEFVDWTQMRLDASSDDNYFDDVNRDIRDNFQAVVNGRFGAEYWIGNVALRAGAAFQPDAIEPKDRAADGKEIDRQRTYLSAGLGYRIAEQLEIDFGWMQEQMKDQYRPYSEVDNAPLVDEDVTRNRFSIGLRAYF